MLANVRRHFVIAVASLLLVASCQTSKDVRKPDVGNQNPTVVPELPKNDSNTSIGHQQLPLDSALLREPTPFIPLPSIPLATAPLHVDVVYPMEGAILPLVDSNFILGSVGNGKAKLKINGVSVPVAPNGAFLLWMPRPHDGKYHVLARDTSGVDSVVTSVVFKAPPEPKAAAVPKHKSSTRELMGRVVRCSDTLATGSDAAPVFPEPGGDRSYMWPHGAIVRVAEHEDHYYRVLLDDRLDGWIADSNIELVDVAEHPLEHSHELQFATMPSYTEVTIPSEHSPFAIKFEEGHMLVTLFGPVYPHTGSGVSLVLEPIVKTWAWHATTGRVAAIEIGLTREAWGYKAFYDADGALHVRIRQAPHIDPVHPLLGIRVVVDAGHPPLGATGPTRLTEADANLAIATAVRELLLARGAHVIMTRTSAAPMVSATDQGAELRARVRFAIDSDADLLLSIHNNAFPDGTNPYLNYGTSTFFYHPTSRPLAAMLDAEIVKVTGLPDLGAMHKSLAIARPTWMPSVLTESMYLMFAQQEFALRDQAFIERLAHAHVMGLEAFLRSVRR